MILSQFPGESRFRQLAKNHNVVPVCTRILADTDTPVSILNKCHAPDKEMFLLESLIPPSRYLAGVDTIKHHIREGDIFQAVYSQPFSCRTNLDPILFYRAQLYINPSPYMFFMNFGDRVIAGYISFTGNMDFAITIRTAVMENQTLTVQSGAGIVYDSDPKTELEECKNKAKSVGAALKLALSHTPLSHTNGG